MSEQQKDSSEIGALWARTSAKGIPMLTGTINGEEVVCFQNRTDNPRAPQWRVMKSRPRERSSYQQKPSGERSSRW